MSRQFHNIETIAPLKEKIIAVWSFDTEQPNQIITDLLVPDGYIQLVFVLGGSYKRRKLSAKHESFTIGQSFIIGIQDKVIMSQNIGELKSIGLQFDPMQFYLLFGDLGVTACNQHLPIAESGHDKLIKLNETISKTASITEAIQEIASFFANYTPKIKKCETWQLTKNCLQYIRNNKGNVSVENIAKSRNINTSTLSINVSNFIGFGPEEMIEIIRTHNTYSEPSIHDSPAFLSIKDLLEDMEENQEG